jgi:hypothetical protein
MSYRSTDRLGLLVCLTVSMMLCACVPEMKSAEECGTQETVTYGKAPDGLVSEAVARQLRLFEALRGDWNVDVLCDPDWGGPRRAMLTIAPIPLESIQIISNGGSACGQGFPIWAGTVTLQGAAMGGLDGAQAKIEGHNPWAFSAHFDTTYDASLLTVVLGITLTDGEAGMTLHGLLDYALRPTTAPDGITKTIAGHECVIQEER